MPATSKNKKKGAKYYLTLFIWSTNAIALVLLLLTLFASEVSPAKTTIFSYLGLIFPFILLVNICYLVLWLVFMKWKLAGLSLIVLIICWQPISTYITFHGQTKEIPENSIKLLSYNVRVFNWKTGKKDIKDNTILTYIRNSNADIVCIQEFLEGRDGKLADVKKIKQILKNYPYYSVTGLHRSTKTYTYGLACFSKFPILSTTEIPLNSKDNGAVLYKIKVKGKVISVINNHLESNRITAEDKVLYKKLFNDKVGMEILDDVAHNVRRRLGIAYKVRASQADSVASFIKRQDTDGIIVCGDFNDTPISYAYKTIKGNLIDSFSKTGKGIGITYHENNFLFRIDFIMHSDNIKSYNCTVDKYKYSDHYPIWTYLELPE